MKGPNTTQLERLTFFSDAVFAIAITLLIIEVHVPHVEGLSDPAWWAALADMHASFMGFMLSFLVIGALWIAHHRVFGMLERYDTKLVWPNLLLLMVVAFMPFATALMASAPLARVPELIYSGSLLAAGLLQRWLFAMALRAPNVRTDIPHEDIVATRWRAWGLPVATAMALVTAWFAPGYNNFLLIGIPLLVRLFAHLGRRRGLQTGSASS